MRTKQRFCCDCEKFLLYRGDRCRPCQRKYWAEHEKLRQEKLKAMRMKDDKVKCGKKCEVYSRVVGYYRPVQRWNVGKQEEFRQRLEYKEPEWTQDGN